MVVLEKNDFKKFTLIENYKKIFKKSMSIVEEYFVIFEGPPTGQVDSVCCLAHKWLNFQKKYNLQSAHKVSDDVETPQKKNQQLLD